MEFKDYREEMKYLRDFLNEQGYLYYVLDAPVIPDYEYDQLNRRLEELEERQMLLVAEVRSLKKLFSDVEAVYSNLQTLLLRLKNGA